MSFSKEWNERYIENTHLSVWPFSDLVSYIMRYARPKKPKYSVLELGCGAGANIPFFLSFDFIEYYGMDGSPTIIRRLRNKFPKLKENLIIGDFTQNIPFQNNFDLIVDRSALTHNSTVAIKKCLDFVWEKLKQNGKYCGIDWFSTLHSDYKKGCETDDIFTRKGYQNGMFADVGNVHFSDKSHLLDLFRKFDILVLEHKIIATEIPHESKSIASWNLVAKK